MNCATKHTTRRRNRMLLIYAASIFLAGSSAGFIAGGIYAEKLSASGYAKCQTDLENARTLSVVLDKLLKRTAARIQNGELVLQEKGIR